MAIVKVGLVQMSCTADIAANKAKAILKIREAAKQGAQIICLQELYTSLYFCDVEAYENFKLAETIPGRNSLLDGFGLIAFASLFPIIAVLSYAQIAEWLYSRSRSSKS